MKIYEPKNAWFCSADGEPATTGSGDSSPPVETPPAAPATSEAAQAALAASDKRPSLLTEEKPTETAAEPAYDPTKLALPEGFEPDKTNLETFSKIIEGVPHKTAQALVDFYAQTVKAESDKSLNFWKETREKWEGEARAWSDDEVKNAKFSTSDRTITGLDAMVLTVKKVLDNTQLTDPKFKEALEFTGLGSNPSAIRTLYRWASQLTEAGPAASGGVPGTVGSKDSSAARSAAQTLYPNLPTEINR